MLPIDLNGAGVVGRTTSLHGRARQMICAKIFACIAALLYCVTGIAVLETAAHQRFSTRTRG